MCIRCGPDPITDRETSRRLAVGLGQFLHDMLSDGYCMVLERCNPWPHVAIRHHHAQPARVCRRFRVRQNRDAPIDLLR